MTTLAQWRASTRVTLLFLQDRVNVWLRFGNPLHEVRCNRARRIVAFAPGALFARIHWEANAWGTTLWHLAVLQAGSSGDSLPTLPGVDPSAHVLLEVRTGYRVQQVLHLIDGIEARGIAGDTVAPSYWRVLHNRLSAGLPAPLYTEARHAAWLRRSAQS